MRGSILLSLAIGLALLAFAAFVVVPRVVNRSLEENLLQEFDDGVLAMARGLGPLVEFDEGRYEFDFEGDGGPAFDQYFEIHAGDGSLLARSAGPAIQVPAGRGGWTPFFFDSPTPDGTMRCVKLRVRAVVEHEDEHDEEHDEEHEDEEQEDDEHEDDEHEEGEPAEHGEETLTGHTVAAEEPAKVLPFADIVVGVSRRQVDARIAAVSDVVDESLFLLGFLMLLFVGTSVFYTWRALRGVTHNLATAPHGGLGPIEWRPAPPRELAPLTQALDGALSKAGEALGRERDVIAGMAHELRTPVAEMLATTEVALDGAPDDELRPVLADVRQVALQMKATVETMLTVARGKAPDDVGRLEHVDLVALWDESAQAGAAKAAPRGVAFGRDGLSTAMVRCDPAALRIVLTTLAENAALHAPAASAVDVSAAQVGDAIHLDVSNPAPHLESADLDHLTEPLWHKAGADSGHRGLGLGLYLASEVAGHAGFGLEPTLRDGRLTVTVRIPAARS